ncbi:vasotab-TY2-like [Frankliniella occidentalis]|uniref:Vasotab-TY2-like n=1 Tax=Frankliniella occidentalis TaxID=133901 RepID=A0A6J1RT28_FRAOC|nr:vasotab-TY2-like [Frankliniella occidentalis]
MKSKISIKLIILDLMLMTLCVSGDPCNIICGRDYNPVCAEFQDTQMSFSNPCMMNYYNCLKGTGFVIMDDGECVIVGD